MMQLADIARATQGRLFGENKTINNVVIDSRAAQKDDLFIAISGDRFDGHQFLANALGQGAVAAIVAKSAEKNAQQKVFANGVEVENTRLALGHIAQYWSEQCQARHLAVTGNSGKTTVKEMLAHLLSDKACHATAGNFNNEIGVPLTLLALRKHHDYGVFELGANHQGEIDWTASLVNPEVGIITNVTGAHLEGFGSLEGIAAAKAELIPYVSQRLVLNKEGGFYDTFIEKAQQHNTPVVTVSVKDSGADYFAENIKLLDEGVRFTCRHQNKKYVFELPLPGEHQVANALQAIAAAHYYGIDWAVMQEKLANLPSVPGRLQRKACGNGVVLDDTYNANPGSVAAALRYLVSQPAPHAFVFGGMGELGAAANEEHARLGELAKELGVQQLVVVGELPKATAKAFGEEAIACDSTAEVAACVQEILVAGGTILVKGSRSTQMENVVNDLLTNNKGAN